MQNIKMEVFGQTDVSDNGNDQLDAEKMIEQILTGGNLIEKRKKLTKVQIDKSGWLIYYLDENNEKWVEEYPNSEHHGGGLPQLRLIEKFPWE